jgi:hypothetical protein
MKKIKVGLSISIGVISSLVAIWYVIKNNIFSAVIFGVVAVVQFAILLPRFVNAKE